MDSDCQAAFLGVVGPFSRLLQVTTMSSRIPGVDCMASLAAIENLTSRANGAAD